MNNWEKSLILFFILPLYLLTGCNVSSSLENIPVEYTRLPGTLIPRDTVWSGQHRLKGQHYVMPGVTLTIEEGTSIEFEYHNNNIEDVGALITLPADPFQFEGGPKPSGRIVAAGSPDEPIVFTSARSVKKAGDWGGVILAGNAPVKGEQGSGRVEGLPQTIRYGGNNPEDDSGILSYVRIEYVGFGFAPGSEINGLSLYGVGSDTQLDHIQVYESTDDGFEWFGGTVNARYLISMYSDDDSFDVDEGWDGSGQFWLAIQKDGADNGLEADGYLSSSDGLSTVPAIVNATFIGHGTIEGNDVNAGLNLRNGFTGTVVNSIISNFRGPALQADASAISRCEEGSLNLKALLINDSGSFDPDTGCLGVEDFVVEDPLFVSPGSPAFNYIPDASAVAGGIRPPDNGFFDTEATYIGAFDPKSTTSWISLGSWVRLADD